MIKQTDQPVPGTQGKRLGMPYDFRRPTVARVKSRWWNAQDHRLFTPKAFGWGFDLNLYWVLHPLGYVQANDGRGSADQGAG